MESQSPTRTEAQSSDQLIAFTELPKSDLWPTEVFPSQLVDDTTLHDGLRLVVLGEDYNHIVILGHPRPENAVATLTRQVLADWGSCDDKPVAEELRYTWARLLLSCPKHPESSADAGCPWCGIEAGSWWLDWEADDVNGNEGTSGYFPVIVWSTEG
jgi:hypothetical protein